MTVTSLLMQSAVETLWLQLCLTPHWAHSQVRSQVGVGSSKGPQHRGAQGPAQGSPSSATNGGRVCGVVPGDPPPLGSLISRSSWWVGVLVSLVSFRKGPSPLQPSYF